MAGGDEGIGIEEAAEIGVVISGLEVIESGFSVLPLAIGVNSPYSVPSKES